MVLLALLMMLSAGPAEEAVHGAGNKATPSGSASVNAPADSTAASSDEESQLVPGRPGFTESPGVVPADAVQFEGGFAFTADETDGIASRTSNVPGAMIRVGLDDRAEMRFDVSGFTRQTLESSVGRFGSSGFGDVQIGLKFLALRENKAHVELSVIPMVSIPSRVAAVSSFGYDPDLTVALARRLPGGFDASGHIRGAWPTVGDVRGVQYSGSVSVGHALWGAWGGSAEVFTTSDPMTQALEWNLGAAVTRQIGPRLQLDLDLGHSLNHLAPAWSFGAGFVVR